MKPEVFSDLVKERISQSGAVLIEKEKEYSRNGDRLWNFKQGALWSALLGDGAPHEIRTLWEYMGKHVVSIADMAKDAMWHRHITDAIIDAKFNDAHNYLYLLEALVRENCVNDPLVPAVSFDFDSSRSAIKHDTVEPTKRRKRNK